MNKVVINENQSNRYAAYVIIDSETGNPMYYEMQTGDVLLDESVLPPTLKNYTDDDENYFIKPAWDDENDTWIESATAAEIEEFNNTHEDKPVHTDVIGEIINRITALETEMRAVKAQALYTASQTNTTLDEEGGENA